MQVSSVSLFVLFSSFFFLVFILYIHIRWNQSKSLLDKHLAECPYESVSGLITRVNETHQFQKSLQKKLKRVVDEAEKVLVTINLMTLEHGYLKSQVKEVMINIVNLLIVFDDGDDDNEEEK